jgi:CheY-like chemotaxis protein
MSSPPNVDKDTFSRWVHDALNNLYDSPYLSTHPLVEILLTPESRNPSNRSLNFRRILLDAIESLHPKSDTPAQSPDWRMYRILELRFIEGQNPGEVMNQLRYSKSQFFRDQANALDQITNVLWGQLSLPESNPQSEQVEPTILSETERLVASAKWQMIRVAEVLEEMTPMIQELCREKKITIEYLALEALLPIRADRVILRQILLNLITFAIDIDGEDVVVIGPYSQEGEIGLMLSIPIISKISKTAENSLKICAALMQAIDGRFAVDEENGLRQVKLVWRTEPTNVLLIVDDNQGLLDLYRRYLVGQNWQVFGAHNGIEARKLLKDIRPRVIMLDVMMAEEDGWEMLMSFKQTPKIRDIPVLICSVVHEPQLAANLGAVGYLIKPVTQQALLEALAPWK